MVTRYTIIKASEIQMDEVDAAFFEFGLDDEVWYEEGDKVIATENPLTLKDIEMVLNNAGVEFSKQEN